MQSRLFSYVNTTAERKKNLGAKGASKMGRARTCFELVPLLSTAHGLVSVLQSYSCHDVWRWAESWKQITDLPGGVQLIIQTTSRSRPWTTTY